MYFLLLCHYLVCPPNGNFTSQWPSIDIHCFMNFYHRFIHSVSGFQNECWYWVSEWVIRALSRSWQFCSLIATGTRFTKLNGLVSEQGRVCMWSVCAGRADIEIVSGALSCVWCNMKPSVTSKQLLHTVHLYIYSGFQLLHLCFYHHHSAAGCRSGSF